MKLFWKITDFAIGYMNNHNIEHTNAPTNRVYPSNSHRILCSLWVLWYTYRQELHFAAISVQYVAQNCLHCKTNPFKTSYTQNRRTVRRCPWTRFYILVRLLWSMIGMVIVVSQPKLAPTIQRRILINESLRKQPNLIIERVFAV